jgi:ATP-binding protein involved in chromosome partitioning
MPTLEQIREALTQVKYPGMTRDIVSFGMVKDVVVEGGAVRITMHFKNNDTAVQEQVIGSIRVAVGKMADVASVDVRTIQAEPPKASPGAHDHGHDHGHDHKGHSHSHGPAGATGQRPANLGMDPWAGRKPIKGVQSIVAVASGKGGVGKSTVATNLAVALAKKGQKVGLMDSDIYGPSVHMMFGAMDLRPSTYDGKTLEPFIKHGVKFMSIGLLLGDQTPVIWRGPMVMKMIDQFLHDVNWGDLDVLVIDLPPGTGDAQLTLVQKVPITGAVIVTTPQNVALMDAVRGLEMFKRVDVPVIGLVENMSHFACPHCGKTTDIFSHGGGQRTAKELNIPLLAEIPLQVEVREAGDKGAPVVIATPDAPAAKGFEELAGKVTEFLAKAPKPVQTPKLNIVS